MIRTKDVQIRTLTKDGKPDWKKFEMKVDNKDPRCEFCNKTLFVAPDGKTAYCNEWEPDHDKVKVNG